MVRTGKDRIETDYEPLTNATFFNRGQPQLVLTIDLILHFSISRDITKTLRISLNILFVFLNICLLPKANGNIDVKGLMKVWTDQKGFPIVNIRKQGGVFHVEQEDVLEDLKKENKQAENR